jgi:Flp pilus assembly CpaF family ATPase
MGHREQRFDPAHPELNLQLPDGSRLFAAMEISSHPTLVIRRHRFEFSAISQLVERQMMEPEVGSFLAAAVRSRKNIIVAGGTGSGKTTLLRALINEIGPLERIVTIEDAYELGIDHFESAHPDHDALQARTANIEGQGEITMADLTRMALRMDPDRVIVGEVRGGEAFPMLLAMSQGNNGSMCTLHADSARSVFPKLLAYVSMASTGVPTETVNLLIASAIHFVVHIEVRDNVRRVTSIHEVVDADGTAIVSNEVYSVNSTTPQFVALRGATATQLEGHGFPRARELSWS